MLLVTGLPTDASLIPGALRAELPAALPDPRKASLAGLPAWIYGPLRDDAGMVEITIAPTTGGVLALVCSTPATSWSAWLDCGSDVHAVATGGAKALTPSADLAFRQVAGPVLEDLDDKRTAARERLSSARRSAPAEVLARAHRRAATTLAPFAAPGAPADAALASALAELRD